MGNGCRQNFPDRARITIQAPVGKQELNPAVRMSKIHTRHSSQDPRVSVCNR
mgnify:CR=1 FL=1